MKVYGIDFASAPCARKPIAAAECVFVNGILRPSKVLLLPDFGSFEQLLNEEGLWIAGIDFPFGQPRRLVTELNWPVKWHGYVCEVAQMSKDVFEKALRNYKTGQQTGSKEHFRKADRLASSCSPMKLEYPPVGKMFFQGAPRLLRSKACVLPFDIVEEKCPLIVEAYPALVARFFIGRRSYKSDSRSKWTEERQAARQQIVDGLKSPRLSQQYGLEIKLSVEFSLELVQDGTGDRLDAMLCAIQAAWSYSQRNKNYGFPNAMDHREGWIVDPLLLSSEKHSA